MKYKNNNKFNDRLDEVDISSGDFDFETVSTPIIIKLRNVFFKLLFVVSVFLCSIIIVWYVSSNSQRVQTNLFVRQALQGNIDFLILQDTKFQVPGDINRPLNDKLQIQENTKRLPNTNIIINHRPVASVQSYSSPSKYQNLYSCNVRAINKQNKVQLYKWKDSAGHTHMSNKFPKHGTYHDLKIKSYKPHNFFSLNLDSRFSKLPAFASEQIKRDVNQIYKILNNNVGISQLNPITLNLKLFDDKQVFNAYKDKVAPGMGTAGGFYLSRLNEAAVYTGKNNQRMYAVIRHEATHAIVNGAFGNAPIWLNEGLAEYFELLLFENSISRVVEANQAHLVSIAQNTIPALSTYLKLTNDQWYSESSKSKHYALGWSLVYFMMSSMQDREFLKYMLDHLAFNYCKPFQSIEYINKHYPGGLSEFENNWTHWLTGSKQEHRY